MRRMYDSTNVADIPADPELVAVYADGTYGGTYAAARKRFPKALLVTITVRGEPERNVCDCENGDLTPESAARWALAEHKAGRHPTIYCSASPWASVRAAVEAVGLNPATDVSWWIAHYDGSPVLPAGAVAKQYLGSPGNSPGHYDVSAVADYWPGVDPAPKPKPDVPGTPLIPQTVAAMKAAVSNLKTLEANLSKRQEAVAAELGERADLRDLQSRMAAVSKEITRVLALKA